MDGSNLPVLRGPTPELCPPRDALIGYARGGRDPLVAGHVARCDRCALFVAAAMGVIEERPVPEVVDVIDITPRDAWWSRVGKLVERLYRLLTISR